MRHLFFLISKECANALIESIRHSIETKFLESNGLNDDDRSQREKSIFEFFSYQREYGETTDVIDPFLKKKNFHSISFVHEK